MGVITDVFAASDEAVQALSLEDEPTELFPTLLTNGGAGVVELSVLESILTGRDVEEIVADHELANQLSDEGPWITRVPEPLQRALSNFDDASLDAVGLQWAQSEEFQLSGWAEADVLELLRKLRELALRATAEELRLFVLNGL